MVKIFGLIVDQKISDFRTACRLSDARDEGWIMDDYP